MTTYIAFQVIHKLREQDDLEYERRAWSEATWFFKKDRRIQLAELRR